jgi:predicted Zn-dependent protease
VKLAEETLIKMIGRHPGDLELLSDLGDLYMRTGDYKRAETSFAELKRKAPQLPVSYVKFSELYIVQGKPDKAENELELAYKRNPNSWRVANDLAYLLSEKPNLKDIDRALELAKKAQTLQPEGLAVADTLGWIYYKKGDYKQSISLIGKVQANSPSNPVFNYHLGMAQFKAGNQSQARESLKKAMESGVKFPGRNEAEQTLRLL